MSGDNEAPLEDHDPWSGEGWASWRGQATRDIGEHGAALGEILDILEAEGVGGPLHWETMTPGHRADVMEQLEAFVRFLDRTYFQYLPDYNLKPCWWRHPDVVWQLTALWAAFGVTYNPKARPSTEQATWHDRILFPTLDRLRRSSLKPCNSREHKPDRQRALPESTGLAEQLERWRNGEDIPLDDTNSARDRGSDPDGELHDEYDSGSGDEPDTGDAVGTYGIGQDDLAHAASMDTAPNG